MKKILLLLITSLFNFDVRADETIHLTTGEWPPYSSYELKHHGLIPRIVTESFALEGINVNYDFFPWERGYIEAREGSRDGSLPWAKTPEREKDFYFSDPIVDYNLVFFHLKSYSFDWKSIDDLKKIKIGVTAAYTYGNEFDQALKDGIIDAQIVTSDKQKILMLLKKRIDISPINKVVGYHLIQSLSSSIDRNLITHHPKPIQQIPTHLLISKKIDSEKGKRLMEAFNRGLMRLKESGKYDRILKELN